jgi:hypothetical protein
MMRLAAGALVLVAAAFPLGIYPAAPVTWLALGVLLCGGAAVALRSAPMVTVGGALALIAHAVALLIVRPAFDPVSAIALGATLTLLVLVVHFAGRVHGAAVGASVVTRQVREWLLLLAVGGLAAALLTLTSTALATVFRAASLPMVVLAAALGAGLAMAGVIALLAARRQPPG